MKEKERKRGIGREKKKGGRINRAKCLNRGELNPFWDE